MKDRVKQMMDALMATLGDGEKIDSVTLSSTYQKAGEGAVLLEVGVNVVFEPEAREMPIRTTVKEGVH